MPRPIFRANSITIEIVSNILRILGSVIVRLLFIFELIKACKNESILSFICSLLLVPLIGKPLSPIACCSSLNYNLMFVFADLTYVTNGCSCPGSSLNKSCPCKICETLELFFAVNSILASLNAFKYTVLRYSRA